MSRDRVNGMAPGRRHNSISISSSSDPASGVAFPPFGLVEKGYRVAVIEMGRRWTPHSFPLTSWSIHRWFWRPKLGLRGFFNMRFFRHATIFHGCAVGRRIDHLRQHSASAAGEGLGRGVLDGFGELEGGDASPFSNCISHAGSNAKQNPRACRSTLKESCGSRRLRPYVLPHQRRHLPTGRGRARQQNLPGSILRRRRAAANHLHQLWRLHDGLPLWREKHSRSHLFVPCGKARAARSFQKQRW